MTKRVEAADDRLLGLARVAVPAARIRSFASRESYSCVIMVDTDYDKKRINGDVQLLNAMKATANGLLQRTVYIAAESQETVDRRWGGDWNHVFR